MKRRTLALLGSASLVVACGGQVVFVGDGGNGGATGSAAGVRAARLANPSMPEQVDKAAAAYAAWVEAGCGPLTCDSCCPEFPGGCVETSTGAECGSLALPC